MVLCGYMFVAEYIHALAQYNHNLLYYKSQEQKAEYHVIFKKWQQMVQKCAQQSSEK